MDLDDWDLLEQFRLARSEHAFGELARRHAGFVLGVCRRRLRDGHDAEDAAQAVFLVLARRPPARTSGSTSFAGWLYKTAIYACNNAMRARCAPDLYERAAAAQRATMTTTDPRGPTEDERFLLDQALSELSRKERDAVLLRYYQDMSLQEVGAALGISQNGATKRIARAIERMREFAANKGMAITSPALAGSIMGSLCGPATPTEFVARTISIGTGQSAASAAVEQIAEGVVSVIRVAKLKVVASVIVAIVLAGGGIVSVNQLMAQDAKPGAQPAPPSTQPAAPLAEPAGEPVDLSTPKGALRAYAKAARAADYETLQRASKTDAGQDLETQLIAAANDYQRSMGELFAAVREKFGDTEVRKFTRQRGAIPMEPFLRLIEAELDDHDVVVDGDTAKLVDRRDPKTETNIKLVRENGAWKVASTGLVAQFGKETSTQRVEMLRHRADIVTGVAEEVREGKYENIDAVGNGLKDALRR